MDNEVLQQQAKATFETLCYALEAEELKFERNDEELTVNFGVQGDDIPIRLTFRVDPKAQVVSLFSFLPFHVKEDKRVEAALAVTFANYGFINGSFDYDITDGKILFRMVSSFRDSLLGEELFAYMLHATVSVVDRYNDKFMMISNGMFTFQQFVEWEQQQRNN